MRVYFIKDYNDGTRTFKAGSNATLWDAGYVIRAKIAVPYNQRHLYESQTKPEAAPESGGAKAINPKKRAAKKN